MVRKRTETPEIRKRQILAGAQTALTKKPYHLLVMDDVARAAGISKGLLYLYFKDKEQLFATVAQDMLESIAARIRGVAVRSSPDKSLEAITESVLDFGEQHKEFVSQFVGEQLMASRHAGMILNSYNNMLSEVAARIQACVKAGTLRPHDTHLAASYLVELIQLYIAQKYVQKRLSKPLRSYAPELIDIFINGFGRKGARRA